MTTRTFSHCALALAILGGLTAVSNLALAAQKPKSPAKPAPAAKPAASEEKPAAPPAAAAPSPLISAMQEEMDRNLAVLSQQKPATYFLGYTITEQQVAEVQGSNGALLHSLENRSRWLEVQLRVGSYELDNTRRVGERGPVFGASPGTPVAVDDDPLPLRRAMWLETDRQFRTASEALLRIETGKQIKVETAEGQAPDFSRQKPQVSFSPRAQFTLNRQPWEAKVRLYTSAFRSSPTVLNSIVTMRAEARNQYQVNSEGTRLQFGRLHYRLELYIQSKAPDGMDINRYSNFDWADPAGMPSDARVLERVKGMVREVEALTAAPLVEPFAGPALLTGRAAAVFFHEVFGHRAEGHRQKDINEGQTFARKVGEQIMPEFITIVDDPTERRAGSTDLLGNYPFDDEGVPAERVTLVERGVLKGFLMSRSPLTGFPASNGHGRRQPGFSAVSRQGNLIIRSERAVSNAKLREQLKEEIRKKGKPFGLLIDDLEGGFTFTGRGLPQAFQMLPLVVYRVYADGRPDELVRGVDIAGTPLVSLTKIVATGDTPEVFNGFCGAESGSVPVAAVSPSILISEIEVQKKETATDKPPILPPPHHDPAAKGVKP